ncbi:hypothetical protein BH10PSE17_BH10PSE17_14260 [soil metagenome]
MTTARLHPVFRGSIGLVVAVAFGSVCDADARDPHAVMEVKVIVLPPTCVASTPERPSHEHPCVHREREAPIALPNEDRPRSVVRAHVASKPVGVATVWLIEY